MAIFSAKDVPKASVTWKSHDLPKTVTPGVSAAKIAKMYRSNYKRILARKVLLDAYNNPEKYPDLLVRIAGYCEYFVNLSDEMKLDLLNRSYYSSGA